MGSVYLVVAWGASVGAADLLPAFGVPDWGVRMFVISAILGFPVAVALAWAYELSSEGIRRDPADAIAGHRAATTVLLDSAADVKVSWTEDGERRTRSFANAFVIGRDASCELCIDDALVSRRHARIYADDGVWHIEDLGSRNGTRVNGRLVSRTPLAPRSQVALCPNGAVLDVELVNAGGAGTAAWGAQHRG